MPELADRPEADELARVLRWRRREALAAGLTLQEANQYAESEIQAGELRRLVKKFPGQRIARILL